jgi:hypothetical protein
VSEHSSFIYQRAKANKVITFLTASISVLLGIFMFSAIPMVPYNYVFLLTGILFPIISLLDKHQLSLKDGKIRYFSLYKK